MNDEANNPFGHINWIKGLQRQALIEELAMQEEDIVRLDKEIGHDGARVEELSRDLERTRTRMTTTLNKRNRAAGARAALKLELGL